MLNKCLILFPPVDTSETPLTSHEAVPCLPSSCKQCAVLRANGRSFNLAGIFVLILYARRSLVLLVGSTRALFPPLSLKSERFGCISFAGWGLGQMAGRCGGNEKVG